MKSHTELTNDELISELTSYSQLATMSFSIMYSNLRGEEYRIKLIENVRFYREYEMQM